MKRYQFLIQYARPKWRGWLLIVAASLSATGLALLEPWPIKIVIDHVLSEEPLPDSLKHALVLVPGLASGVGLLALAVVAVLLFHSLRSLAGAISTIAWVRVGQAMVYELAQTMFANLQRRSLLFHSRNSVGDSMSRIADDSYCVYTVADAVLLAPAQALITIVGMVLVMWRMDPVLALVAVGVSPFVAASSMILGRTILTSARVRRRSESRITSHVQQTLTGIAVVQAFGQEEEQHRQFQVLASAAIRAKLRSALAGSIYELGAGLFLTLGLGAVLWVGARHVLEGRLTVGGIIVFLTYVTSLQEDIKAFTRLHSSLQDARASVERVMEVLEMEREVVDLPGARPLPAARGRIMFDQVTFGYRPGQPVLNEIELEVASGQTLALVGRTGAGKSTLVSLLPRFFDPWQGRVLVDGHDVRDVTLRSLRDQVGIVLQEPFLFPLSVAENIAYGRVGATRAEIESAARAANAHDFISRLPAGYDTVLGERGGTLSGGERQRLAIARAFVKDAPILILDEPTSALDADTEALLLEALERLMAGRTTVIIAHRLSTIRNADVIAVLEAGRLVELGSHGQLLDGQGVYARLYRRQLRPQRQAAAAGSMAG